MGSLPSRGPQRWARWLSTLALSIGATSLVLVEWSFPYCSNPEDGPVAALFGAPFPFLGWSGGGSMEFDFAWHFYLLDVALVALVLAPLHGAALRRLPLLAVRLVGGAAALALLGALTYAGLLYHVRFLRPTTDIFAPPWVTFTTIRPVGVTFDLHYDCVPLDGV